MSPCALAATRFEHFEPFSAVHAVVVGFVIACVAAVVVVGRIWRGTSRQRSFELVLAAAGLAVWIAANGHPFMAGRFAWSRSLPLHVTDVVGLLAPLVLVFARARPARAMLYYWGIGLGSLAFITPDLKAGPAGIGFWLFFGAHLMILVCAFYDLLVRDFRPNWRDWRIGVALSLLYVACMIPLNLVLDSNYGFVGKGAPGQPSLIDILPGWPWRVLIMVAMGAAAMALLTLPWTRARPIA